MTDNNIVKVAREAYNVGVVQKTRKEKWAYDRAKEHGAVDRYREGIERLTHARNAGEVKVPTRTRDVVETTTIKIGIGHTSIVPRLVMPSQGEKRVYKLSPNAHIRPVNNVGSPYRAIRAAIDGNAHDVHVCQNTYNKKQERARAAIKECDNLVSVNLAFDQAMMQRARWAMRGNSKNREAFRALCHNLAKFSSVNEALDYLKSGGTIPKGCVNESVCRPSKYYIDRVIAGE